MSEAVNEITGSMTDTNAETTTTVAPRAGDPQVTSEVVAVPVPGSGVLVDADTREELEQLRSAARGPGGAES